METNKKSKRTYLRFVIALVVLSFSFPSLSLSPSLPPFPSSHPNDKNQPLYPQLFINYSYLSGIGKYRHPQYSSSYSLQIDEYGSSKQIEHEVEFPGIRTGFSFEIGSVFWINSWKLNHGFKLGISATFQEIGFLFGKTGNNNKAIHVFNTAKGGPILSYNPIDALLINVKATLEPTAIFSEEETLIRGGIGIDVRYKRISIGLSFSSGNTSQPIPFDIGGSNARFSTNIMRFSFGLNFNSEDRKSK